MRFESFVNTERCKTARDAIFDYIRFESFVNSERCKTIIEEGEQTSWFESFVNSERCKTIRFFSQESICLRALLIQKDVKLKTVRVRYTAV